MIFSLIALALTLSACAPAGAPPDATMPMGDDPMTLAPGASAGVTATQAV